MFLQFRKVNFTYPTAVEPLFQDLTVHFAPGWCGVLGPNGTGKTTFLKLATGLLELEKGHIDAPTLSVYCPQRTDNMPDKMPEFNQDRNKKAQILRDQLGIREEWQNR